MDDYSPVIVAANKYNAIGELVTKYLHGGENGNNFNQKIDYRYTIRGWLAGINQPGDLDGNLFALSLAYEDPQGTELAGSPRYNGNISQMRWHTALAPGEPETEEPQKGYGFTYDRLNRLRDASYADGAGYNLNAGRYGSSYLYDDNGNLEFLSRQRAGSSIDALSYHYPQGSNQLESVTDDATDIPSDGYLASVDHYQYDRNGNMTLDPSKNTLIDYNELNLPSRVDFDMDKSINYTYDALGNKLQKRVVNTGAAESTVDYSGAFVYENKRLRSIFTPEGRLGVFEEDSGSGETNVLYKFEYHLKDHLGNVRVVFGGHSNGQPEYIQRTDYYPFGLVMAQKNYTSFDELSADRAPFENKYLYNGKEWQNDEVGGVKLDWYDYGARMYDPELARFHTLDPLAESYNFQSPFVYAANDPIRFIDYNGEGPFDMPGAYSSVRNKRAKLLTNSKREYVNELKRFNRDDKIVTTGSVITMATISLIGNGGAILDGLLSLFGAKSSSSGDEVDPTPAEPEPAELSPAEDEGIIYEVDGENTPSGKEYVGSTNHDDPAKRGSSDGRNRKGAKVVDTYKKNDKDERRYKEQKAIDQRGGKENLDNKRREVNEKQQEKYKKKYGDY